jgi:hypothetical protein
MSKQAMTFTRYLAKKKICLSPSSKSATDVFFRIMREHRDSASGKTFLVDHLVAHAKQLGGVTFVRYLDGRGIVLKPWQIDAAVAFLGMVGYGNLIAEWQGVQAILLLVKDFTRDYGNVFEV